MTTWLEIALLPPGDTSYVDSGLLLDTTYYYRIKYNGGPYSGTVNCTTLDSGAVGSALIMSCSSNGQSSIDLSWDFTGTTVPGGSVTVQRSENFSTWTTIHTAVLPGSTVDSYTDSGLATNTVYYYRSQYTDESGYSNIVSCQTGASPTGPCEYSYSVRWRFNLGTVFIG